MKRVILRFYRNHDMDLIVLHKDKTINFRKLILGSMEKYMKGDFTPYALPEIKEPIRFENVKGRYQMILMLDENKSPDKEIIRWMESIRPLYRNAAIKNLTRAYISGAALQLYFIDQQEAEKTHKAQAVLTKNCKDTTPAPLKGRKRDLARKAKKEESEERKKEKGAKAEAGKEEKIDAVKDAAHNGIPDVKDSTEQSSFDLFDGINSLMSGIKP